MISQKRANNLLGDDDPEPSLLPLVQEVQLHSIYTIQFRDVHCI
jgi:hypothetical protein